MKIIPFIKGQVELKTSKQEFAARVRSLTEKDLHYLEGQPFFGKKLNDYARDSYDKYFNLWRIPGIGAHSSFIKTIIHCDFDEKNDKLFLRYHIRFNFFGNAFILLSIALPLFCIFESLLNFPKIGLKPLLLSFILYPLSMWNFNDSANYDLEFLKKLTEQKL